MFGEDDKALVRWEIVEVIPPSGLPHAVQS